ncbi:10911_t:CDS:2, partial [Funneliformis caledonium]
MLLPTGYNSDQPPSSEKFCDYDQCSILLDTENSRQVLICGHVYHSDCLKILNFGFWKIQKRIIDEDNENDDMFEMDKLDENYLAQE